MSAAKYTGPSRSSGSHHDYNKRFEKSIISPYPEEWTPAHPILREANRLEKEGADQMLVDEMIEKARQEDSIATSYYLSRWAIIKRNRPNSIKINPSDQT